MKKLLAMVTIGLVGLGVAAPAHAEEVDNYPEIPNDCLVPLPAPTGPARATHAPAGGAPEIDLPDCADLDVCIVLPTLIEGGGAGPGRLPHVESAEDCGDVPEECIIDLRDRGPGRVVHSPTGPQPTPEPTITPELRTDLPVYITQECQEQLSLALAPVPGGPVVGSNSTPTILMASTLVFIGGLLVIGQRRLARR